MLNESNLHNYQLEGVAHILENTHAGLFLDMGLGKTVTTLTAIKKLMYEELEIDSVLIIAPKRVATSVWTGELEKWGHLKNLKISRIIGTEKQRLSAVKTKADIYTIGRENVPWLVTIHGYNLPYDMLVIDESSSFKNPSAVRFKALKKVQPLFKRVVALTGTPAPNGLMDLWPQLYLLDRGERLGKTITAYRETYFYPKKSKGHIVYEYGVQNSAEEAIYDKIGDICMSMKAKDYLTLPPRIDNYVNVYMDAKHVKAYNDFEREQVLQLIETEADINAVNAAALSNKLLQFANGAIYDEARNWHEVHRLKLDALEDLIEGANGKPILVAWTYRHDEERILKHFAELNPRALKTEQDERDWNAGKIQLMLMHPASGGHGLNLQAGGNIIVWFGQTWSLELYQQFNARLDRQGQTNGVIVHHLVTQGTEDETVIKRLAGKDSKQEALLAALKSKLDKYKRFIKN